MGVFKNDVGRPTNKSKMLKGILKGVCALVIAGALLAGGYYLNDYQKKVDNKKTVNNKEEKISDSEATSLFNKYNLYTNWMDIHTNTEDFSKTFSYFYNSNVTSKTISDSIKFAISLGNLYIKEDEMKTAYGRKIIYKELDFNGKNELDFNVINKKSIELFGKGININNIVDEENSINVGVFGYNFKYNPKTKTIIMPDGDGVGDGASIDYYTKIIGNKVSGNKLEITNKVMFLVCTPVDDFCYISKTTQDINNIKNTLTTINNSDLKNINIDDYLDKLDSYKWTFVKNKAGNYVFESVEKLK